MMVKIGPVAFAGPSAIVFLLVLLAGVAGLVVISHPSLRMLLSAALWTLFIVYWSAPTAGAKPVKSSESVPSRRLHQYLMNGAILLLFLPLPGLRQRFIPLSTIIVVAGLALQASAALFAVWARRHLGRNWSGAVSIRDAHELVRSGPYRLIRHPIYTGMLGMAAGTAIVSGEVHALLAFALLTAAYLRKIPIEERALSEAFGPAWDAYHKDSWAIVPGLL